MLRKFALLVALAFAAIMATVVTPAYADCVSDATVTYVGADWGPVPMWRVAVPSLNATWDVQADDAESARARVAPLIACPADAPAAVDSPAPAVEPAPAPAGVSDLAVGQATQVVLQADVTYVGNAWGPIPIWRVHVPSRNATYDVAATDADAARAAVLGTVAADIDRNPDVAPAAVSAALAPSLAAASNGTPVSVDTSVVAPVVRVVPARVVAPAKSKTAKRGVHATPATSRTHR